MEFNLKVVFQWKIIKFGSGNLVLYSDYSTPIQINYFSFTENNIFESTYVQLQAMFYRKIHPQ